MIRRLQEVDREASNRLLYRSPQVNLYALGNLESYGFDQDFCQFWGDFGENDLGQSGLRAILNRYGNGWTVYGLPGADWNGLGAIIDGHEEEAVRLQDNPGGVDSFLPYLGRYRAAQMSVEELMALTSDNFQPTRCAESEIVVQRATLDDLAPLVELYQDAGHMSRSEAGVLRPLQHTRIWIARSGSTIVSAALTNAETERLAMIGGVFTRPEWRGRGLSQAVCSGLCDELLILDKQPTLYWATPAAGAVYRKLGFQRVGDWRSIWLAKRDVAYSAG